MAEYFFHKISIPTRYLSAVQDATAQAIASVVAKLRSEVLVAAIRIPMKLTKAYRAQRQQEWAQKANESKQFVQALRKERADRLFRQRNRQHVLIAKLMQKLDVRPLQQVTAGQAQQQPSLALANSRVELRRADVRLQRDNSQLLYRKPLLNRPREVGQRVPSHEKHQQHLRQGQHEYVSPMRKNYSVMMKASSKHYAGNRRTPIEMNRSANSVVPAERPYDEGENRVVAAIRQRLAELNAGRTAESTWLKT